MKPPDLFADADPWDLYRAAKLLAGGPRTPGRVGVCLDVLFNDLELYDDPDQWIDWWNPEDERPLVDELVERLHAIIGSDEPSRSGSAVLASEDWSGIRLVAGRLASALETNGLRLLY